MKRYLKGIEYNAEGTKVDLTVPEKANVGRRTCRLNLDRNVLINLNRAGLSMEVGDSRRWMSWEELVEHLKSSMKYTLPSQRTGTDS